MHLKTLGLVLIFAVGCSGGGAGYETAREASLSIFDAFCTRRADCQGDPSSDIEACVNALVSAACQDRDCNDAPRASDSAIDSCIDELLVLSCSAQDLPGICNDIL